MNKLSLSSMSLTGKRLFMRVDFNVPLDNGIVQDDTRIRAAEPSIRFALDQGASVVLASHLGRPKGMAKPELSLKPVADRLNELTGLDVGFSEETVGERAERAAETLHPGGVLVLENLRFHKGETSNDPEFSRALARLGDVYANDAFGTAHRAHASTAGMVSHFEQAAAGLLMEKELHYLQLALEDPPRPFVGLLGGAKVSDKIEVVRSLLRKVDRLLIGGGMAYTFIRAQGHETGTSLVEEDKLDLARDLMDEASDRLVLPVDHVTADSFSNEARSDVMPIASIPDGWMGLDIGPETIALYAGMVREASLVLWNGPMGVFEMESFAQGTLKLAEAVAASEATSIVGGGDSVSAVQTAGVTDRITHVSTGGGASLAFLAGETLPGVDALTDA